MPLARKPFPEFAAELAAGLAAGRGDEPIAESARFKVIEVAPGDWRLRIVFNHAVEVVGDESFPSREAAIEEIVDRLVNLFGRAVYRADPVRAATASAPASETDRKLGLRIATRQRWRGSWAAWCRAAPPRSDHRRGA